MTYKQASSSWNRFSVSRGIWQQMGQWVKTTYSLVYAHSLD